MEAAVLEAAVLEAAVLEAAVLEAAVLEAAVLEAAVLEAAVLEAAVLALEFCVLFVIIDFAVAFPFLEEVATEFFKEAALISSGLGSADFFAAVFFFVDDATLVDLSLTVALLLVVATAGFVAAGFTLFPGMIVTSLIYVNSVLQKYRWSNVLCY